MAPGCTPNGYHPDTVVTASPAHGRIAVASVPLRDELLPGKEQVTSYRCWREDIAGMRIKVRSLTREASVDLVPLLADYDFRSYSHYGDIDDRKTLGYALKNLEDDRGSADTKCWIAYANGSIVGLASLMFLRWDTERLGVKAARIGHLVPEQHYQESYKIKADLLEAVLHECTEAKIKHLTYRVNSAEVSSIHLLEALGFLTVDGMLTFSYDLRRHTIEHVSTTDEIRIARDKDLQQIKAIASTSFSHDRFHSDPRLPKKTADSVYTAWLENSYRGEAADAVIVIEQRNRIVGFVTCRIDRDSHSLLGVRIGSIVLVAVDQAARGQGVASALTRGALGWFREQQADLVEVGTQLKNTPAARLYESTGFRLVSSSISMRKWLNDQ